MLLDIIALAGVLQTRACALHAWPGVADWRAYEIQAVAGLLVVALTAVVWRPKARVRS